MSLPDTDQEGSERRAAPRMRVLKRAKVIFNNGYSTLDCVVRNVSATGALLTLAESAHMPKEFKLTIGDADPRPARLVYRRTMFAGVRFADIPEGDDFGTSATANVPQGHGSDSSPHGKAKTASAGSAGSQAGIARIASERFPVAVTARFPWTGRFD